ncbi:histidine kinase [Actinomadura sp. J1-007]|uniref:sensor histidine kinase n=1 Tax=Actinomadura sp. J1-007 TaxID=2661913 RepID=UPI002816148A|nr:histidine kinase [Actinomadura sp. J1-007]
MPSRMGPAARFLPWSRGRTADAALAGGLLAGVVAVTLAAEGEPSSRFVPGAGWALATVACLALYWRRTRPLAVGAVTGAACAAYYPLTEPDGPLLVTFCIALYSAASAGRLVGAGALVAAAVGVVSYGEISSGVNHLQGAAVYLLAGWFVAIVALGGLAHNRRAYLREAERRALAAEHGREEEARRRATEERLRIAREVHDAVGHNISLINVQAAAALHASRTADGPAERALAEIKQASKDTLRELRTTLGVLRQVDASAPGLARLDDLAARTTAAGVTVRTDVRGDPRPSRPTSTSPRTASSRRP